MATRTDPVVVTVRFVSGTHQTNTIGGQRASSTSGYLQAAQALAHKLFPHGPASVTRIDGGGQVALEVFEIRAL